MLQSQDIAHEFFTNIDEEFMNKYLGPGTKYCYTVMSWCFIQDTDDQPLTMASHLKSVHSGIIFYATNLHTCF